ncbi:MAG: class I SAM-dependent methyltransferase [Candidatus Dormibacteria bacterium]
MTVIRERSWYHTIDLPDGTTTAGYFDTRSLPEQVRWPAALQGGLCLDVGTFDGFWAFEMERRGAEGVVAVDIDDPADLDWPPGSESWGTEQVQAWGSQRGPGFAEAAQRLGSRVERLNRSVYDLDPADVGRFDVVLCGALLLHLRDPVRALERMREVCAGELVLVECLDPVLDLLARGIPAARFAPGRDQWWRANLAGLRRMVEVAGFEVTWSGGRFLTPFGPGVTHAVPTRTVHTVAAGRLSGSGVLTTALGAVPVRSALPQQA